MKKCLLSLLTAAIISSASVQSEELVAEIKSGQYCQSELFKQFKKIEQTAHQRLKFKPSDKLLDFVASMELMCPWETQRDYNGDNKPDWIGFTKYENDFQLVAYISAFRGYKLHLLSSDSKNPQNAFVKWTQTGQLKKFTDKELSIKNLKYSLQVTDVKGMTDFYLWDGNKMAKVFTTPQIF